ncbi:MAG: class II fructose-bisphosphate aldolase [Bacteroidota bacterium]
MVNLETLQAVVRAAEAERTPVIVQVWHGDLAHAGGAYISAMAQAAAQEASIPVALQLDHGQRFEQAMACIEWGFSSVMIDLSSADFDENVASTRRVVEVAHAKGVSVEAELGKIYGGDASVAVRNSALTDPELAAEFAQATGIDALAASIGTAHGLYSSRPVIDFGRLEKLVRLVQVPIVVHGGSDTPTEDVLRMIKTGVAKVNVGTDLMNAFNKGLAEALTGGEQDLPPRDVLGHARACVEKVVREKIRLFSSLRKDRVL